MKNNNSNIFDIKNFFLKRINKKNKISDENFAREQRITKRLNLNKLPFFLSPTDFCTFYIDIINNLRENFKYREKNEAMQWCLSNIKRFKVFLIIFEANELGNQVYKENISSKLPEYSYKTIAKIIDDGLKKGYFIKLNPRIFKSKDKKIRNIRPSEDLAVEFINWNLDIFSSILNYMKKYFIYGKKVSKNK